MKRILTLLLVCTLLVGCFPCAALAKAKQMNDDVPVWNEESVRQYALDYVEGKSMERLWGYYDLQIRRYMPQESFAKFLTDLEFLTGGFVGLGSYRCFEEPENELKVHVIHLCMEKLDIDMYLSHKDKEDDWEIMSLELVPAEKETPVDGATESRVLYKEESVTLGTSAYPLEGILAMPVSASASNPVPACVLLHDFGPQDRDHTVGKTRVFADFAKVFGEMGIATLRYDKRTLTYPDAPVETVKEEVIEDALSAIALLHKEKRVQDVFVLGLGMGGMLTPRIAAEADGAVSGMLLIGSSPDTLLQRVFEANKDSVSELPAEEEKKVRNAVRNCANMKEAAMRELTLFGHNGYYFWEAAQYDAVKQIKSLRLPVYCAQGAYDTDVKEDDGRRAYYKQVGPNTRFATYTTFRALNHLLMNDLSMGPSGKSQYAVEAHLDVQTGRTLALWILKQKGTR